MERVGGLYNRRDIEIVVEGRDGESGGFIE